MAAVASLKGINFALYVDTSGTPATPVYTKVAAQRGTNMKRSRATLDSTSKDSTDGFKHIEAGLADWAIDFDGLYVEDDAALLAVETAFMNGDKIKVSFQTGAGAKYQGFGIITDFPIDAPYDKEVTYKGVIQGDGAPTKVPAV